MKELIQNFPHQLKESLHIADSYQWKLDRTISNIVICGLGGSGIGGEIVTEWLKPIAKSSIYVCHGYHLPAYVTKNTLVIACSYSGNTEETLNAVEEAFEKNALVVGITSGGTLETSLKAKQCLTVKVPGGLPPRAALAYPLVQILGILVHGGLIDDSILEQIKASVSLLNNEQGAIQVIAKELMQKSLQKQLLFYAEDVFKPCLLRGCQQINENSKALAFYNVIPEMNHNEIVGWANEKEDHLVCMLRSNLEDPRNQKRLDTTKEIISKKSNVYSLLLKGNNLIEQSFYAIHLLDWLSFYLAEEKNIDVMEVHVIDYLKSTLAN